MRLDNTSLESNKPNTLNDVADDQEVLHSSQRRNVYSNVEESNADQALILVECSHKDLGRYKIARGYQAD